ncbi:ankyrin [Gonapodya prolifera JEL478]|uniref:Ankyrin n=1 Tax=Gonapodya prolifera (strain JEL478) TaxID=1344416 RepID=A0A139A3L0_GONPJ|nr:ankyrin [Gonapodya prolifera JEL478]|eukprot:KXS10963.1 ankyrin [Gonapodya prolifera JEL478]
MLPSTEVSVEAPASSRFHLLDLPPEIIQRIGRFCADYRLAFPSSVLNRCLRAIFSVPADIAARGLRHFETPELAVLAEVLGGDTDVIKILCGYADVNALVGVSNSVPPLVWGARAGNVDVVRCLLDIGADLNLGDNEQAVVVAAEFGHVEVVKLLLDCGASNGYEALSMAITRSGSVDCARILVDHGVKPDGYLLWVASAHGEVSLVEVVIKAMNLQNVGRVPDQPALRALLEATQKGREQIVRVILESLPEPPSSLIMGRLVMNAASRDHMAVIDALLDFADLEACCVAAMQSASQGNREGVLQVFRQRGVIDVEGILVQLGER